MADVDQIVKEVCSLGSIDFNAAMDMLKQKGHIKKGDSRKRKCEETHEPHHELQSQVDALQKELDATKSQLKACKSEIESLIAWQRERERQHEADLEYANHYDEDSYCRHCGKSSCICERY